MENEYITFEERKSSTGATIILSIYSKKAHVFLGEIKWFGAWRKYCFFPHDMTIFDNVCLEIIQGKLEELMKDRKSESV